MRSDAPTRRGQGRDAGASLVELLVAVGIMVVIAAGLSRYVVGSDKEERRQQHARELEEARSLLRDTLRRNTTTALHSRVWINPTALGALGLTGAPWASFAGASGAILATADTALDLTTPALGYAAAPGSYVVAYMRKDAAASTLQITGGADSNLNQYPTNPYLYVDAVGSVVAGDVLAASLPIGVELFRVDATNAASTPNRLTVAPLGTFTVNGQTVHWPVRFLEYGTTLFRPVVSLVGRTTTGQVALVDLYQGKPPLIRRVDVSAKTVAPVDNVSGLSPGTTSLTPGRSGALFLRVLVAKANDWNRPTPPIATVDLPL